MEEQSNLALCENFKNSAISLVWNLGIESDLCPYSFSRSTIMSPSFLYGKKTEFRVPKTIFELFERIDFCIDSNEDNERFPLYKNKFKFLYFFEKYEKSLSASEISFETINTLSILFTACSI